MSVSVELGDFISPLPGLSEDSPIVSMEIRLGKDYDFIDFDYDEYAKEAARLDLDPRVNESLNIELGGFHRGMTLRKVPRTRANPTEGIIQASVRDEINADLAHEMQHIADGDVMDGRYVTGQLAKLACLPLTLMPPVIMLATEKNGHLDIVPDAIAYGIWLAGLGILNKVYKWGYTSHPAELRARQAEKESTAKIVTFQKKA